MARLASLYSDFQPEVVAYLRQRHRNEETPTEELPKCPVTTGLLIALHITGLGKSDLNDLVDIVIALDVYSWITIPDMASAKEQDAAAKRCRNRLRGRIKETLGKVAGKGGKDRLKMIHRDTDPADIRKCLNRLLAESYVPMPCKVRKKRKPCDDPATTASSVEEGVGQDTAAIDDSADLADDAGATLASASSSSSSSTSSHSSSSPTQDSLPRSQVPEWNGE
jgi:hypothetical protein